MMEFAIKLRSVQDVQDFVALATTRAFPIHIRDAHNKVNGKSFMEMFCLDFTCPLRVVCNCSEAELERLRSDAGRFLVK